MNAPNPEALSAQDLFDTVVRHLARQGRRAHTHGLGCRYRTDDGLQCAVGCLITDEEYSPKMDDLGPVDALIGEDELPKRLAPHAALLRALQNLHDSNEPSYWPKRFREVGATFNLDLTAVNSTFPNT